MSQVFLTLLVLVVLTPVCICSTLHRVLFVSITELAHSLSGEILMGFGGKNKCHLDSGPGFFHLSVSLFLSFGMPDRLSISSPAQAFHVAHVVG